MRPVCQPRSADPVGLAATAAVPDRSVGGGASPHTSTRLLIWSSCTLNHITPGMSMARRRSARRRSWPAGGTGRPRRCWTHAPARRCLPRCSCGRGTTPGSWGDAAGTRRGPCSPPELAEVFVAERLRHEQRDVVGVARAERTQIPVTTSMGEDIGRDGTVTIRQGRAPCDPMGRWPRNRWGRVAVGEGRPRAAAVAAPRCVDRRGSRAPGRCRRSHRCVGSHRFV